MDKQLFIQCINALDKQNQHDNEMMERLSKAYPDADKWSLRYDNHHVNNAIMHFLQVAMNDTELCQYGQSWLEYYCFECDFGRKKTTIILNDREVIINSHSDIYALLMFLNEKECEAQTPFSSINDIKIYMPLRGKLMITNFEKYPFGIKTIPIDVETIICK